MNKDRVLGRGAVGDAAAGKLWLSRQWQMIKATAKAWMDDYAPSMGAALSYYTLFSLAPLLIIVIAVAGMIFGQEAAQGEIAAQLRGIMSQQLSAPRDKTLPFTAANPRLRSPQHPPQTCINPNLHAKKDHPRKDGLVRFGGPGGIELLLESIINKSIYLGNI